jgi:tRNA (adenine37-N6)-methyltransferase
MDMIQYRPVGIIHTPFSDLTCMPIQPPGARGVPGEIDVYPEFAPALDDLEGFSRVIVIYHFHQAKGFALHVTPFLDEVPRGLFATRAPCRPNPIGLSVIRIVRREDATLRVMDVDMADGTPVLDIKPYIPDFDSYPDERCGWMSGRSASAGRMASDNRFSSCTR